MPVPTTTQPHVLVFHPGAQHSHYLAVGVQRAGMLERYITQLYYKKDIWFFRWIKWLPLATQARFERGLRHRYHPELDSSRVQMINTIFELIFVVLNRLKISQNLARRWGLISPRLFSRRVGRIARQHADIIIGTEDASREAFQIAKRHGVVCILDASTPHVLSTRRILNEERQLVPELSASIAVARAEIKAKTQYAVEEIPFADYFFVGSSFPKQSLVENGVDPARVFIIPYGVDISAFSPREAKKQDSDALRVLFVGKIDQSKGISYLLEAVHQLKPDYHISLVLCGPISSLVQNHPRYKDDFTALGRVDYECIPDVYRDADVYVQPSPLEGFSRTLAEAMASGLPIIATDHTGAQDVITEGIEGFVIPIRDTQAIKDKLIYLYESPDRRRAMAQAARQKAIQFFSWDRYYAEVGRVLNLIWENYQQRVT